MIVESVRAAAAIDPAALGRALALRGIDFVSCATGAEAREWVLARIPPGATVMNGSSLTVERLGLLDALASGPYEFLRPRITALGRTEERVRLRRHATTADYFVGGINAITASGEIVNVDGSGNRIAAYAYGAGKVFLVCGPDKIVPDLAAAIRRIREVAAPMECRVLGKATPCVVQGACDNDACRGPERQCGKMLIIENEKIPGRMTVIMAGDVTGH